MIHFNVLQHVTAFNIANTSHTRKSKIPPVQHDGNGGERHHDWNILPGNDDGNLDITDDYNDRAMMATRIYNPRCLWMRMIPRQ